MTNKIYTDIDGVAAKARPFKIMAKPNNDTLAILIHGFSGSPYDLHVLAENLAAYGIDVEVPLLAGHGSDLKTLAATDHQDWIKSAENVLLANLDKYSRIFLIGYSVGANISLHLSIKYPQVLNGVISLGIFLYKRKEILSRLLLPFTRLMPNAVYTKSWLTEEEKRVYPEIGRHVQLTMGSVRKVAHFLDNYTKRELSQVTVPVLVIHSRDDEVSHPRGSEFLFNHLTVADKSLYILNKHDHNPVLSGRRDFVFTKILDFIKKH